VTAIVVCTIRLVEWLSVPGKDDFQMTQLTLEPAVLDRLHAADGIV
jgi:hypothetical protein